MVKMTNTGSFLVTIRIDEVIEKYQKNQVKAIFEIEFSRIDDMDYENLIVDSIYVSNKKINWHFLNTYSKILIEDRALEIAKKELIIFKKENKY